MSGDKNNIWFIIQNPESGGGKSYKDKELLLKLLAEQHISFIHHFSEYHLHSIELSQQALQEGYRKILVIGGDGTLNEAVNGVMKHSDVPPESVTIGIIPIGRGNDWARSMKIGKGYKNAIIALQQGNIIVHDVGVVDFGADKRYFINICDTGFGAYVADTINFNQASGRKTGKAVYFLQLFKCLLKYKAKYMKVYLDGRLMEDKYFTIAAAINKYNGGGMMQAPDAIPDDGLLDITLIRDITKLEVLRQIINLFDGSFVKHPKVSQHRVKEIRIEAQDELVDTDGESAGKAPVTISILPQKIKMIKGSL